MNRMNHRLLSRRSSSVTRGSLTLVGSTVKEEDTQTSPLVTVDANSSLDVSSGDNEFHSTVSGTGFIAAAAAATVVWDADNALNVTTNEDGAFVIDARVDGSDIVNLFTSPATNGSVIINVDGTLTYTPAADFYGTATFDFETADGATGTVNVTVRPVNDQPTFENGTTVTVGEDASGNSGSRQPDQYRERGSWPANETDGVAHGTFGNPHNNQSVSFAVSATNSDVV